MNDVRIEEFVVRLDDDSRKRHKHSHFKGKVINFAVQLEIRHKNHWQPILRYDTAHGFAHKDFIYANGEIEKIPLFLRDYNEALIYADNDIKNNWELYKKKFLKGAKNA